MPGNTFISISKIATSPSPILSTFYCHHPLALTLDTGATSSLIRLSVATKLDMKILPTNHTGFQADGKTRLRICGEIHETVTRNDLSFMLQAVVVEELDCDVLAGNPFMEENDIVPDPPRKQIIIQNRHFIPYSAGTSKKLPLQVRRTQSFLLRSQKNQVVLPGDFIELQSPTNMEDNTIIAIEPRCDTGDNTWIQPLLSRSVAGVVRIPNLSHEPVSVGKHRHLAQAHYTAVASEVSPTLNGVVHCNEVKQPARSHDHHSSDIKLDPDHQLSTSELRAFNKLHDRYDNVFNKRIGKYNNASGPLKASINMGPVEPPTHKARLPSYNTEKLRLLQEKMDELEHLGILAKPEEVGVTIEHVSPSFLVKKIDGSDRLVTAFNTIGTYARPPPSRSTSTDKVLSFLASYNYIIKTDMTKQFFQLSMAKSSMKYLGTLTPFKGLRIYTRAAMGIVH